MELFDKDGHLIDVVALDAQIGAVPYSLDDLDLSRTSRDPRTPCRLFSSPRSIGQKEHTAVSSSSSWLSPLSRCMTPQERANCAYRLRSNLMLKPTQQQHQQQQLQAGGDGAFSFPKNNVLFIMFNYPVCIAAMRSDRFTISFVNVTCSYGTLCAHCCIVGSTTTPRHLLVG